MNISSELSFMAWVSLLWTQYNKLSDPLKEGFVNLAKSIAKDKKELSSLEKEESFIYEEN